VSAEPGQLQLLLVAEVGGLAADHACCPWVGVPTGCAGCANAAPMRLPIPTTVILTSRSSRILLTDPQFEVANLTSAVSIVFEVGKALQSVLCAAREDDFFVNYLQRCERQCDVFRANTKESPNR
jgi:hypothetical protein